MSAAQLASNKATFSRFHDATNSGDAELISKTIDEVVEPDVVFHAPVPTGATGAQALKQVWAVLLHAFPDLHVTVEDVIAEGDKVDVLSQMRQLGLNQAEQRPQPGQ
jgi:predicted ester cyclase